MKADPGPWRPILAATAEEWRSAQLYADRIRGDLIDAVAQAAANGVSEYAIAEAVGVTRLTVRAWLGKGKR